MTQRTNSTQHRAYRETLTTGQWQRLYGPSPGLASPSTESKMATNQAAIEAAKKAAQPAPTQLGTGPEWPRWEEVSLEDALTMIEVDMWSLGAKFSFGLNADAKGMWARVGIPKWASRVPLQGKSAITFASGLEHLIRKVAQLTSVEAGGVWKDDPYAK
jgi:hypothetical protein